MHDQPVCKPVHRLLEQPVCMTFAARLAGVNCHNYVSDYCVGRHTDPNARRVRFRYRYFMFWPMLWSHRLRS